MLINKKLLDEVTTKTKANERLRMNFNLHDSLETKAQRLLNALELGTILPVHRHQHTAETYIILRNSIRILFYNNEKTLTRESIINPKQNEYGIHIPAGQWHTLKVLESSIVTLLFHEKSGYKSPKYPRNTKTNIEIVKFNLKEYIPDSPNR